jgi:hypothetical protein
VENPKPFRMAANLHFSSKKLSKKGSEEITSITGVIHSWFFQIHWHYICIMPRRKNTYVLVMLPFPLNKLNKDLKKTSKP